MLGQSAWPAGQQVAGSSHARLHVAGPVGPVVLLDEPAPDVDDVDVDVVEASVVLPPVEVLVELPSASIDASSEHDTVAASENRIQTPK
jgi:hypothetical protein